MLGRQPEHPQNDQVVVGVGLHLGALRDIEDVLHRERVEVQALAEPGHDLGLAEAVDIDPRDAGLVEKGDALVERHALALDDVRRVVAHHADLRGLAPLRRRKRARRRARPKLGHAPATAEHAPDRHLLPLPRARHDLRHSAEALRWLSSRRGPRRPPPSLPHAGLRRRSRRSERNAERIAALRAVLSVCYARSSMNASFREVAVDAATRAGALLRAHLGGTREVSYKGSPINLVTEMDRRSEALIVEAIQRHFPDHGDPRRGTRRRRGRRLAPLDRRSARRHHQLRPRDADLLRVDRARDRRARGAGRGLRSRTATSASSPSGAAAPRSMARRSASRPTATLGESLLSTGYQYDIRSSTPQ